MIRKRGREHTSLTETAAVVVRELKRIPGIKMIAPGEIRKNSRGSVGKFITCVYTPAGFELLISGQSSQRVAVHTKKESKSILATLKTSKRLREFHFKERSRKPGI